MLRLFLFGFVMQQAAGVIYRMTPQEYDKLPKIVKIDEYGSCMLHPGEKYCMVEARLHGNLSDPLYNTMVEYSARTITHFDHTKMNRGICINKSCAKHLNTSSNLTVVIEACLNESMTREYNLTTTVMKTYCEEYGKKLAWDNADYAFLVVILVLAGLNTLGSVYDFFCEHGRDTLAGKALLCFSIRQNWRKLVAPASPSPMQRRIKVVHGVRTFTAFLVVCGHSPIPSVIVSNNPLFLEMAYHFIPYHLFLNGTLIVQVFFLISGLLMAYNMLLAELKRRPNWQNLPKGVLLRWLRLTPPYAFVIFLVMTWMRHMGNGPFYMKTVTIESNACHRDWWRHLLYIANYQDHSQCMVHAWYLAAEFQLSVIGLVVFCLLYNNRYRKFAIAAVMLVGLLTPAVHTYLQDLHAVLVVSPEVALSFFVDDPTFNNLYKRGHTNLVCYGLGMALAYVVFNLKDSDIGAQKYKKYRFLYWMIFPIITAVVFLGYVFYIDGYVVPMGIRVVYSGMVKLVYGFINCLLIFFTIVKVDRAFRGVLNWGGWARISRVTYFAYLLHVPIMRFNYGVKDELISFNSYYLVSSFISVIVMAYTFAVPLYLTVENPVAELVKLVVQPPPRLEKVKSTSMADIKASKETLEMKL